MISGDEFDALFDSFTATAFRLETLPAYDMGGAEADRLAAWREGRPRPVQSVATSPWLARIARTTMDGKRWTRVRVVDDPLTDYQRFQLEHAYREAQACGDDVRIISRTRTGAVGQDFWLFDAPTWDAAYAIVMSYDPDGHWLGAELTRDARDLDRLRAVAFNVSTDSTPLNEYLAERVRA